MPLHPQAEAFLAAVNAAGSADVSNVPVEQLRQTMEAGTALTGPQEPVAMVRDIQAQGPAGNIPVRLYYAEAPGQPPPVIVYFHGGGWVTGSIQTHDRVCRALANASQAVVASVEYRCAPEHVFPAAIDDSIAATCWLAANASQYQLDPQRFAVAGDSAGGNLAASVAISCRDDGGPDLVQQTLIYPVTNNDFQTRSYRRNATGYYLTRADMQWFWQQYLPDGGTSHRGYLAAPLTADLHRLPPAVVITAGYDPLCDEGEAYAAKLKEAGTATTLTRFDGMIHGFIRRPATFDAATAAMQQIGAALQKAFTLR